MTEQEIADAYAQMRSTLKENRLSLSDVAIATLTIGLLQLNKMEGQIALVKERTTPAQPVVHDYGDLTPPGGGRMV